MAEIKNSFPGLPVIQFPVHATTFVEFFSGSYGGSRVGGVAELHSIQPLVNPEVVISEEQAIGIRRLLLHQIAYQYVLLHTHKQDQEHEQREGQDQELKSIAQIHAVMSSRMQIIDVINSLYVHPESTEPLRSFDADAAG